MGCIPRSSSPKLIQENKPMSKHIRTSILSFIFGISLTFYPSKGISQSVELIPEPGFLDYISGFDIQT